MTQHRVLVISAVLVSLAAVPAAASTLPDRGTVAPASSPSSGPPSRSGGPHVVYDRVAHFYGAYIDVANDPGSNAAAAELRKFYLTPALRQRLLDWEKRNDADGVLMAQNVPNAWKVTAGDSGMGKTRSTVRLTWGAGKNRTYTYLEVSSDLATRKIVDIRAKY
ncbi:hypothetical protein [Streptomyces sp. NBC_01304]|uniref:hypothetical protein n=1 Tax=Streptomyces sp. NBC_01304 TaxID=2903818 RepID=UPI002E0F4617|nr:hypothetical protein OG430_30805 [Streptomyces sp. NBC_01304]